MDNNFEKYDNILKTFRQIFGLVPIHHQDIQYILINTTILFNFYIFSDFLNIFRINNTKFNKLKC